MIWIFVVLAALLVFAVAAVTVGREAFRLGHQPPPTIFDLDEAVEHVADELLEDVQARLTYDEVRILIAAQLEVLQAKGVLAPPGRELKISSDGQHDLPVVVVDDDAVAVLLGEVEDQELDVSDQDVFLVVAALNRYLERIGAVGPSA